MPENTPSSSTQPSTPSPDWFRQAFARAMSTPDAPQEPFHSPDLETASPAVNRCCEAYDIALQKSATIGRGSYGSTLNAKKAFRQAMPTLSGPQNIRDFIACVAHGLLIEAISGADAARLLYAAQVANSSLASPSRKPASTEKHTTG